MIETPLGAWVRLDALSPELADRTDPQGMMLRIGMLDAKDTRYAEVVLSQANLKDLVEAAGGHICLHPCAYCTEIP